MRNLHQLFDWQYIGQIICGDFAKFCGLLRIYELYHVDMHRSLQSIFFRQNDACTLSLTNDGGVKKETISPGYTS